MKGSTVGLIVGGVALAGGGVAWFWTREKSAEKKAAAAQAAAAKAAAEAKAKADAEAKKKAADSSFWDSVGSVAKSAAPALLALL